MQVGIRIICIEGFVSGVMRGGTYISYNLGVRERVARRQGFTRRTTDGGVGFRWSVNGVLRGGSPSAQTQCIIVNYRGNQWKRTMVAGSIGFRSVCEWCVKGVGI